MAISFPPSPKIFQKYTYEGVTYTWVNNEWVIISTKDYNYAFNQIQINDTNQFDAFNIRNLNFRGINLNIFSADTNTLVFSAQSTSNSVTSVTESNNSVVVRKGDNTSSTFTIDAVTGGSYSNGVITFSGSGNVNGIQISGFSNASTFTGGTVNGPTNFTNGLTANTISATTYNNLPKTLYTGDGTISGNRIVDIGTNTLNFNSSTYPNNLVMSGGNVGIGTSSPTQKLEVNGDALIRNAYIGNIAAFGTNYMSFSHISRSGTGDYSLLSDNAGITYLNAKSGQSLRFRIDNIDKVILDSSGNLGVGTTSPSYKLDVSGDGRFDGGLTANTIYATTYQNLPTDITVTGATYSNNTFTYRNNTGGTFSVLFNTVTGLTVNGGLTANTFSGNSIVLSNSASTISLNNPTQQQIRFFDGGRGTPSYNSYSAGAKIIFTDNISSISSGHAIGVDSGSLWYGADLAGNGHDWYAGQNRLMSLISSTGLRLFGLGGPTTTAMVISGTSTSGSKGGVGYMDFLQVTNNWSGATNPNKWFRTNSTGGLEILNSVYTASTLTLSDNGILYIGGGAIGTTTSSDGTSNYLSFNGNNSQIYDDGNMHIHSRGANQVMWINTNGGGINLGTQSPVSGGGIASSINCGSSSVTGYFNINTGRTFTDSRAYGYLSTGGAGAYGGGSQSVTVSLYATSRIWGQEIDAFSDERMKDIQGEVTLDDGLKLVNNLKPIKYTWKDGEDKGLKVGYSAQQVSKSGFDHLVALMPREGLEETIDDDGFVSPKDTQFSMNYDQVTPYHGVVIKHLLEEIENLKKEIQLLKNNS